MVNWDAKDVREFKVYARAAQKEYCDLLGDREWDEIDSWNWNVLRRKVGFGMFGPPSSTPSNDNQNTGYDKEQRGLIEKICDQLVVNLKFNTQSIHFACIFVIMKVFDKRYTVPVFKAKASTASSDGCVYVDTSARKYPDWANYLSKNTLQKCIFCFPSRGLYECNIDDEVRVGFRTSPACDLVNRVLGFFDSAATVVAVGATVVGVASLCAIPIAGPVLTATAIAGTSTGAYGATRNAYALYDRATHSQRIDLGDAEARAYWLSIAGSSLGFVQGRMVASMSSGARAGEVMGKAGRIAFFAVQTGSLTVNGIGIAHGLATLVDKSERDELTALDVFQFSASVLFFTNSVINFKTANTIIKEVQHDVIDSHRGRLSGDARKLFNKHTGRLRGRDEMHGNAKVVKVLNSIESSKDVYEMMADKNVKSHKVKLTPKGFEGLLEVNKNLRIHPLKLLEIPPESRQAIFESTKNYANGSISKQELHREMKIYCRKHQISFESMRKETLAKLCQMYGKDNVRDIVVGDKRVFANATPHEVDRLRVVLENTTDNSQTILELATEFAGSRGCATASEFIAYAEYFVAELNDTVRSYEAAYKRDLAAASGRPGFSQAQFDEARGIRRGVRRTHFHKQKALDRFAAGGAYDELNRRYNGLREKIAPLNRECRPGFFSDEAATYHYVKHKNFGAAGDLTPEQYFQIAEEVVGTPTNRTNAMLSQDGQCTMITYTDPVRGVRAVKIDRQGDSGIATVMYDKKLLKSD